MAKEGNCGITRTLCHSDDSTTRWTRVRTRQCKQPGQTIKEIDTTNRGPNLANAASRVEHFRSTRFSSSSEVNNSQQGNHLAQIQKLTDIASRHDDEIDGMSDCTHEIIERRNKETMLKMVIKAWLAKLTVMIGFVSKIGFATSRVRKRCQSGGQPLWSRDIVVQAESSHWPRDHCDISRGGITSQIPEPSLQSGRCTVGMKTATTYSIGKEVGANWVLPATLARWALPSTQRFWQCCTCVRRNQTLEYTGTSCRSHRPRTNRSSTRAAERW